MNNFNHFVNYRPCSDCIIISCKLNLWSIKGPYNEDTAKQAEQKYLQFKALDKYKNLPKETMNGSIKIK